MKYSLHLDETKRRPGFDGKANEGERRCGRSPWSREEGSVR